MIFSVKNLYYLVTYWAFIFVSFTTIHNTEERVHGRYTRNIVDYELVVPYRITQTGQFVSFVLPQHYKHDFRKRYTRDLRPHKQNAVHYNLVINDQDHHIELWPNHGLLSPNFVQEVYRPDLPVAKRKIQRGSKKLCHFVGRIRGHKNSNVALSLCNGMSGYVATNTGRYFIEPVAGHEPNANGEYVHIVYKREFGLDPFATSFSKVKHCGTNDNWSEAWLQQLRKRKSVHSRNVTKPSGLHSAHRYLELLVVADKKFLTFHKNVDVEKYIMTIMNMVSNYYHDSSVGNQIDVTVVRIMYLEKEDEHIDLMINQNAEETLSSFCKWQMGINPADIKNPQHHDIAILLTRYDLCSDNVSDCSLLGLAYVATACDAKQACAINEDTGLTLGVTVTHEMGHVMGCGHDNGEDSSCTGEAGDNSYFIMAPSAHMATTRWSPCSRKFITELFENGLGDCLNDEPQESLFKETDMPPGSVYDVDFQCNLDFPGSTKCTMEEEKFCSRLFCRQGTSCNSKGEPPADGTSCGENKWCYKGECVDIGKRPNSVNGDWGEWQKWSECSRTCGGGVQIAERECNNPEPKNKGRYCIGERKQVKLCNTEPCEGEASAKSFRAVQCSEFNSKPFQNKLHTWEEYFVKDEPCKLYCVNENKTFVELAPRVKDGTPCKPGTKDKCIFGVCRKIGCDMVMDSTAIEDQCGICNGDGTHCTIVDEVFEEKGNGYHKIVRIPKDSRNIKVTEKKASQNTIAVSDESGEHFYLNGKFVEERDGDYDFGGVRGVYDHPSPDTETLLIAGPLIKPILLHEVFYSAENPGIQYTYAEPLKSGDKLVEKPVYNWDFLEFDKCSTICGPGIKIAQPECVEKTQGKVADKFCHNLSKPEQKTMDCNERECKIIWHSGNWGKCSGCKTKSGVKTRKIECVREANEPGRDPTILEDKQCTEKKPAVEQLCCSNEPCPKKRRMTNEYEDKISSLWWQINKHLIYKLEKRDISNQKHGDNKTVNHECEHTKNIVTDKIPPEDIKLIEIPVKGNKEDIKLSDQSFEQEGDKIPDMLDFCQEHVYTGKKAEQKLKEINGPKKSHR